MKKIIYDGEGKGIYDKTEFPRLMNSLGNSVIVHSQDWDAFETTYIWKVKDMEATIKYYRKMEPSGSPERVQVIAFGGKKKISGLEDKIRSELAKRLKLSDVSVN